MKIAGYDDIKVGDVIEALPHRAGAADAVVAVRVSDQRQHG